MKITKNKSIKYLYGVDTPVWSDLRWIDALKFRIQLSEKVLKEINDTHFSMRDDVRKEAVMKAIQFNQERLEEK